MAKFFLQMFFIFNTITDSFLVEERGTLERARKYFCKNLGNTSTNISIVRIVFVLAFIKLLINEESFGNSFSFSFPAKYFDRNFKYLLKNFQIFLYCTFCIVNFFVILFSAVGSIFALGGGGGAKI